MTEKLFVRSLPESVTWNEFFAICRRADALSMLLDKRSRARNAAGKPMQLRTISAHNQVVSAIHATIDAPGFYAWAEAQDLFRGDLPLVRFASHPKHLAEPPRYIG